MACLSDRVLDANSEVRNMCGPGIDTAKLKEKLYPVLCEAALVKLHKRPLVLRFSARSAQNGLKQPSLWLTALLRSVQPDTEALCPEPLHKAEVTLAGDAPWYATRSTQVVDTVRRFNIKCTPTDGLEADHPWRGDDVVCLHTNINTQDLITALASVLDPCFHDIWIHIAIVWCRCFLICPTSVVERHLHSPQQLWLLCSQWHIRNTRLGVNK